MTKRTLLMGNTPKSSPYLSDSVAKNSEGSTRREFLRSAAIFAAAAATVSVLPGRVFGANEKLGVGFIGAGGRAQAHLGSVNWLSSQNKQPVRISAVCDAYRPRAKRTAEKFGATVYGNHSELLKDPAVDIVCIATPDHHHAYQALDAIAAGKDVYCEKPVTHWRQFELIKKLCQEGKKSGRVFQLGSQGMSDSAFHQAKKLIQEGLIGQPVYAECGYFRVGDWGERGMPIDDPKAQPGEDLNWELFLGDSPKRPFDVSRFFRWRMYEDYAGGPCTDLYPHSLTPVVHMLGVTFPKQVVASGGIYRYPEREVPDTFSALIDYPEKITVALMGTQANDFNGTGGRGAGGRSPIIRGHEGTLTFAGKDIVFTPAEGAKNKQPQKIPVERQENLVDHWTNLIECARNKTPQTWSPVDLAYHVQTALIMGYMGLREGKVAKFDTEKQEILL